jgi:CRP-like cAMP-binding protein
MKLKQYDYFGERALLNDAPRAATVTAVTSMKLLYISKARLAPHTPPFPSAPLPYP